MNIEKLLYYTYGIDDNTRAVRDGIMLTMQDPTGRTSLQIPIESIAIIEESGGGEEKEEKCVVVQLVMVENALFFKYEGFDEDIKVWRCGTPPEGC